MDPATITMIAKAAVTDLSDEKLRKTIGWVIAAILSPIILIVVLICSLLSGTANHNNTAVDLTFNGGVISGKVPEEYRAYITEMRDCFTALEHKPSDFRPCTCTVDKIITIPQAEFEDFVKAPLRDRDFIAENIELMYCDENYLCHCMLVLGKNTVDGIIVESEGYSYARKAAYLPNISPYIALELSAIAGGIITDGALYSRDGSWTADLEALENQHELFLKPGNGILEMLKERLVAAPEVIGLSLDEDGFSLTLKPEICMHLAPKRQPVGSSLTKLSDILCCNFEDVHLCHRDIDDATATISELSNSTLTDEGKQAWADVLGAEVHRIYTGMYGLQIELSGVKAARIYDFGAALAGYCSTQEYEKWFTPEPEPPTTMTMTQE